MNDNIKLILGAGVGVLILTAFIILFIILRRQRNKKMEKREPATEGIEAREAENLISNPTYSNNSKDAVDTKPGVEVLHYPRDRIEHNEMLEDGMCMECLLYRGLKNIFLLKNLDSKYTIRWPCAPFDLEVKLVT